MNKSRQFNNLQNEMRNLDDMTPEINERAPKEVESTHSPEKAASIPFCQAFKRDTKLARLSQREIAERLNVSQQSVSKWLIKNYLPKRHREPLARFLKGSLGEGSLIWQSLQSDVLTQTMRPPIKPVSEWARHTQKHSHSAGESPTAMNSLRMSTDALHRKSELLDLSSIDTHNSWLAEVTRQFNGVETHYLYTDPAGIRCVYDIAIPRLNTYFTCTGTFSGYKPVRELQSYSSQLVKQCAIYVNTRQNRRRHGAMHIVVLNGICWRDQPTENEVEISKWLESVGISMIHARSYTEAIVMLSHFYHQTPNDAKNVPYLG